MTPEEQPQTNYPPEDLGSKTERSGFLIANAISELKKSINNFSANIEKYSKSSDKYYKAIIWLTIGLVLVGVGNIIVELRDVFGF